MFTYHHRVQFYETDLMGIVHHSNYLRIAEEARVAWAVEKKLIDYKQALTASEFAVLETKVKHLAPCMFGDNIELNLQARRQGARIIFQYKFKCRGEIACLVESVHVSLDKELRPQKLSKVAIQILEKELWTETWL